VKNCINYSFIMAQTTSIELETSQPPTPGNGDSDSPMRPSAHAQEFSLKRVDGGKDAWLFLAACFVIEALTWGFPFSFGVFQDYYSTHEPFAGSTKIAIIGTCAMVRGMLTYLMNPS
jgi:hypothetical protein